MRSISIGTEPIGCLFKMIFFNASVGSLIFAAMNCSSQMALDADWVPMREPSLYTNVVSVKTNRLH